MEKKTAKNVNGISRRDFIKGAAMGAAGIAAAGIFPANIVNAAEPQPSETASSGNDWLGTEPSIPESSIAETVDVDVVVVGAGLAGVCAARAAAEQGAKVVLIEKSEKANCRSGEYAVLGGKLNEYFGRPAVDPDKVVDRFMRECAYRIKRPIISRWANEAHEAIDWYIEAKPDLYIAKTTRAAIPDSNKDAFLVPLAWPQPEQYDYNNEEFPTFPNSIEFRPSQAPVFNANVTKCTDELGVKIYYGHFSEKLEKSGGRVTGVLARDAANNRYLRFNAKKGIVLATGDNGANKAIQEHFTPAIVAMGIISPPMMGMDVEGKPVNTGDGLKMGAWIGAKVQNNHAPMTHHMGAGIGITPFLLLNKEGRRFMNESVPGQQLENQIELQSGYTAYQIFDDGWREQLQYMPANHGGCCYYDNDLPKNNESDRQYMSDANFDSAVENGSIKKAATLEALLDELDIDKAAALASIERYNGFAKAGHDDDFNKPAQRVFALEKGPFYACTLKPTIMLVNVGGLESDENCHVFDSDGAVIPGLYVAGNVQGSRYAVEYPICMRGISHSMAAFYGRVAGNNVAAGV